MDAVQAFFTTAVQWLLLVGGGLSVLGLVLWALLNTLSALFQHVLRRTWTMEVVVRTAIQLSNSSWFKPNDFHAAYPVLPYLSKLMKRAEGKLLDGEREGDVACWLARALHAAGGAAGSLYLKSDTEEWRYKALVAELCVLRPSKDLDDEGRKRLVECRDLWTSFYKSTKQELELWDRLLRETFPVDYKDD